MPLRLQSTNDGFTLQNEKGSVLALSRAEVAELVDIARQMQDHTKQLGTGLQYRPVPTQRTLATTITLDAHHTSIVLQLTDENGLDFGYLFSSDAAVAMRDALSTKIDQLELAQRRQTKQ